ncbi:chromosome segregation protein ParM [Paraglaciecola sp. MB-3u-78]|jgi:hypothetical protein|uniref:chromosome segregation protein ParM n=1 Tax=Paraglaciecola sp. MB-3u-78 TaxID=2058332 RepID=UPI0018E3E878|nr:chromosome segregation protein ParM [Paraglaciecola sp. MB-3u-78]
MKDVLLLLFAIERKGGKNPVGSMALLNSINDSRNSFIADKNFRTSCHKMVEHGLVEMHRGPALKLYWKLTNFGRTKAETIYNEIIMEQSNG